MKRALICGISGQDGAYLSQHLLNQGYEVWGSSRDAQAVRLRNLATLGIESRVRLLSMSPVDFRSVLAAFRQAAPDEVYNLTGQSSVGLSFEQPVETFEGISIGTLNLLEAIRFSAPHIRFYNAGSGEIFGDTGDQVANESTRLAPKSPYAVAKATAHWTVASYREAYSLYACSGILFNHESPLRPERFVTRKVIRAACAISAGSTERLKLGNIGIVRDWGWAPEYVVAMHRMLQQPGADDFIVATGESHSLEAFVELAFRTVGLDWRDHVDTDPSLLRPSDHRVARASGAKAADQLGWRARFRMPDVVREMVQAEQRAQAAGAGRS